MWVEYSGWEGVSSALQSSLDLLDATLQGDTETVEKVLDKVHTENVSVLAYNDENSLSCVITIAYYAAKKDYFLIREMPAGKGFADIVFLPREHTNKPALIIELKWDKSSQGAIAQIKKKNYAGR